MKTQAYAPRRGADRYKPVYLELERWMILAVIILLAVWTIRHGLSLISA